MVDYLSVVQIKTKVRELFIAVFLYSISMRMLILHCDQSKIYAYDIQL